MSSLTSKGLSTVYVSGDLSDKTVKDGIINGQYQLVLISGGSSYGSMGSMEPPLSGWANHKLSAKKH